MPESGTSSGRPAGALSNDDDGSEQPSEYRSLKFDEFHSRQANEQSRQGQSARTYWPTKSSGESGSEADDEGFTFLKALPPPPVRQRKGLRSKIDEDISPLLTPSRSEERTRSWANTCVPGTTPERTGSPMPIEKQTRKLWNRRKREAFRRIVELLLFASVIHVVLKKSLNLSLDHRHCGVVLISQLIISLALFLLYPLRMLLRQLHYRTAWFRSRPQLKFPISFDPATILYPSVLPALVALSVSSEISDAVMVNVVLGIAALPTQLVPNASQLLGLNTTHWVVSLLPVIWADSQIQSELSLKVGGLFEPLSWLFPLHQALVHPLYYLTTTSLLPAELHLLSISLINLLMMSSSSWMIVLKALLWIGGLLMFVGCKDIIRWAVALARVPRWRLRRPSREQTRFKLSFHSILTALFRLCGRGRPSAINNNVDSDADEDGMTNMLHQPRQTLSANATFDTKARPKSELRQIVIKQEPGRSRAGEHEDSSQLQKRRSTAPLAGIVYEGDFNLRSVQRNIPAGRRDFKHLTLGEAVSRKWMYALSVYLTVLLIILYPVRLYISQHALQCREPLGWVLGYMFGDLQPFRYIIQQNDLESWVLLPPTELNLPSLFIIPFDHFRSITMGIANTRLAITIYWMTIFTFGVSLVLHLRPTAEVDTCRKIFHGMMVLILIPTIPIDPSFVALALALALALFLLLEILRASQLPPLSRPLATFLTPYVDGRDLRGPVIVSHIFLLLGCATPLWLALAGSATVPAAEAQSPWQSWELRSRDISMLAGPICVGLGDAAASLVGRRLGRTKWLWPGGKSIEGSLAFAIAVSLGLVASEAWLSFGWNVTSKSCNGSSHSTFCGAFFGRTVLAACGASLTEAVLTAGNDNIVVPVVLWLLVRALNL